MARLREREPDGGPQSKALCQALLPLMQDRTQPAPVRCVAGEAIDLLDTDDAFGPPGLDEFVPIKLADGTTIRVGKYPVTNRQYARFVDAGGYSQSEWWSEEGWRLLRSRQCRTPGIFDDSEFNHASKPLVGVSWYEANAYCSWLTARLRALNRIDHETQVRLPTEAEWESIAYSDHGQDFPWGSNTFDTSLANTAEFELDRTTSVHMYPHGATPEGVWDMAGNVWEWILDSDNRGWPLVKGGSFQDPSSAARTYVHYFSGPNGGDEACGFRVVVLPIPR